jgi:hypothetical protein
MKSSLYSTSVGKSTVSRYILITFIDLNPGSHFIVSVYKIPPLKTNEGHRANDWGDLAQPLWKGRLRIMERSDGAVIRFEDATTGALHFAPDIVRFPTDT